MLKRLRGASLASFLGAFLLSFLGAGAAGFAVFAVDFQSDNFILRDPVIVVEGGRSTSTSFEFISSTGQPTIGESTSSGFIHRAGFLYFEEVSAEPPAEPSEGTVGGAVPGASVSFSGKAYPRAEVILLKDGRIAGGAQADGSGNFTAEARGLSPGEYLFSLYARDYTGKSSRLISFFLDVALSTITTVRDVVMPPTISVDKRQVAQGDPIDFFGQSAPGASLRIAVATPSGELSLDTLADQQGRYRLSLDTSSLEFGDYSAFAAASLEGSFSDVASAAVFFVVGTETIFEEPTACPPKGDLNNDCFVNLVDLSILIYWFDHPGVPARIDLNGDGRADLVDFSILAYYWTG